MSTFFKEYKTQRNLKGTIKNENHKVFCLHSKQDNTIYHKNVNLR